MNGREWRTHEDRYLKDNAGKIPCRLIAAHLGRTKHSVYGRAAFLGISLTLSGEHHWKAKLTELQVQMIAALKEHGYTADQIKFAFNLEVSPQTIRDAAAGRTWR